MDEHAEKNLLSSYMDEVLMSDEKNQVESHLEECLSCSKELEELRHLQLRLAHLPHHEAPAALMAKLKKEYAPSPWLQLLSGWFFGPALWKPIGAFVVTALLVSAWILKQQSTPDEDFISLEPLLAAHSRYKAESLVPSSDMASSNFSAQLAVYQSDNR